MVSVQCISMIHGRFWDMFPIACVVINDACAFFAGITFGKTKLIALSPNKTLEGFIGGMIFNVIGTFIWVGTCDAELGYMFCGSNKYDLNIYETFQC